ncbi:MAG: hypothetical protein IJW66_05085 [Clostridia bacterium]|nr:hypothetical protein [Clostridia bacterium]
MRYTTVYGLDDGLNINLGHDVSIIAEVMDIGTCEGALIYKARMSGEELIAFMRKFKLDPALEKDIKEENRYILTAYDW